MYHYQEYNPDILLTPWIKNYWSADGFWESKVTPKVFPDGCTDIIFTFDRTRGYAYTNLLGTTTSFIEVDYPQSTQMFGIRFKPAGITAFTRIPVNELTDQSVELALLETLFEKSFYEALPEKQSFAEIVAHTNRCLINQLPRLYHFNKQIIRAVDLICLANGKLNLAGVASDVCLSQRHFERQFKSTIGISPKLFAKILRFKQAVKCLHNCPHKDLATIAEDCGYYDYTHLQKDFKSLSGDTPSNFRAKNSIF